MLKKRTVKTVLSAILLLCLAFSALSCADGDPSDYEGIDYLSLDLSKYVTLGQYKGLNISIDKKPVITDTDVTDKINADLIYSGYTERVTDRAVTKKDTVSISYVGLLDGVAFNGGTGNKDNFTVYNGGGFIDGFADGLIGAMPGEGVDVNVTFPKDYHSAEMAGKAVVFKVTVHHIYEAKPLTDELASLLTGGKHKTVEAIRKYYSDRLIKENDEAYEEIKSAAVWNKIFAGVTDVNIPEKMINERYAYELYWAQYYADSYNMDLDAYLAYDGYTKESLREQVRNNIITDMVIYSIMKAENVTVTDEDYNAFIAESGYSEKEWLEKYTKDELKEMFRYSKTYDEAVKWQSFHETETGIK